MKVPLKFCLLFIFTTVLFFGINPDSTYSQTDKKAVMLKPGVNAGDLLFAYNQIDDVEIAGAEVNSFIEVKTTLKPFIDEILQKNITENTPIKFEIAFAVANNFVAFLERSKLKGSEALKYKRVVDAFRLAAQEATNASPSK
ncbi:MAG: hypothetical protein CVV22_05565 [Ignavibacteriae bacterium HGW-Ignavibacteriae-1]|jgi:hypothetical protein|nr:MAG: hypothetical protein CVV22_05565 [Ignavibacteriae bacterium HGW-Ignavibacteriae-1]